MKHIIFALSLVACATVPTRPDGRSFIGKLQNLYCLDSNDAAKCTVWRSEQPSAADFLALNVASAVKLNSAVEGRDHLAPGAELIDDFIPAPGPVALGDGTTCRRLHDIVDDIDNAPKPTDVHCTLGDDRTGIVVGFWRLWTKTTSTHPSARAVWGEMLAHGFHDKLYPLLVDAFADCSGYDPRKDPS